METMKPKSKALRLYASSFSVLFLMLLFLALGASLNETHLHRHPSGVHPLPDQPSAQNFVSNGGFENDLEGWTVVGDVFISEDAHSGAKALLTSDPDTTRFSYVWQELNFGYDTTEVTVWVYPGNAPYRSHFGLINGWRTPEAVYTTLVSFRHNAMIFVVPGANESFANVLTPNAWNKVVIQVNSGTLTQDLSINDTLVSSLTATSFPPVEHLLVGDLSRLADYGTVLYDDISITGTVVSPEPIAVDDNFVDNGPGPKFFPVLRNDVVPVGTTVEISIITPPQHGQVLSIEADGIWFQKDEGYEGPVEFSYAINTQGQGKSPSNSSIASIINFITQCVCRINYNDVDCPQQGEKNQPVLDPLRILIQAGQAAIADSLDLDLLLRWRDDVLRTSEAGTALFDTLMFNSPEILQLVLFDQPELRDQIITLFAMVQDPARSLLEGDGSAVITQDQMDAVAALFADLSAGVSDELRQIIQNHVAALGPLDQYVGLNVGTAFALFEGSIGIAVEDELFPTDFVLEQNFPNPFETETQIRYALKHPVQVSLAVYDIQGRRVRTLLEGQQGRGIQSVTWDGLDESGMAVPTGVYFVRLTTPTYHQTKKMVVMK
jgi:hypothetical protein